MEVISLPQYLSPSSLNEYNMCQMKFYLKRMAGLEWPPYEQGIPAAVGSAFDSFVKNCLAECLGYEFNLEEMLSKSVQLTDENERETAIGLGEQLFQLYEKWGFVKRLIDKGITFIDFDVTKTLEVGKDSVPVRGLPDAFLSDGTPVDWKVQGATSVSGASPTKGYNYRITEGVTKPAHKDCDSLPFEQINESWASQMAIYSWLVTGIDLSEPILARIENVTMRGGKVTISTIERPISPEFQKSLWERLVYSWQRIQDGRINLPTPSPRICNSYNQLCEVSDKCEAYQRWVSTSDPLETIKETFDLNR